ncbi:hypothetical protein [Mailhella sp.]|uniref:hypothetical protein n=1 Tax=Mailhella sp. TaxID=1981029 RepID=UPI003AB60B79
MSDMLFFDRQDRELMKMINAIIDYGPSSDLEHKIFNAKLHPHGILNLTTSHEFRMAQAVINLLGSLTKAGPAEDRLAALRTLHDEVLHSAQTTFRYNTGRALIQIMKAIIRSRDDEDAQLRLIHDFRKAASGNPRIVREFLTRHHLMEMPEEWNQLTMDHHVHDANTKGRKNATFLIMDAWVKGIRYLTVVYYNFVELDVARELLSAASIMGISVRIGLEFRAAFRGRYVDFIWAPRGFSDIEDFLEFLSSAPMRAFMDEGRNASNWLRDHVMRTLETWNKRHAPALTRDLGIPVTTLDPDAFLAFVGNGQPSLLHLAEFAHKALLPRFKAKIADLTMELEEADDDRRAELLRRMRRMNEFTPSVIHDSCLAPNCNPELPSPEDPPESPDDDRPELLKLSVPQLLERLSSLRSGYRITLQLAGLTAEDVLELLWDGQGFITHLELFNVKEWHDGNLKHLKEINELQIAINKGDVMLLKRMLRGMLERFDCSCCPDTQARCEKFRLILAHIPALQALYRYAPLASHMGTDSTSHLGNRYGMGLAVPETLPASARKRLTGNKYISSVTLPLRIQLGYREEYLPQHHASPPALARLRRALGQVTCGMRRTREWEPLYQDVRIEQPGNIVTMGGLTMEKDNGLLPKPEDALAEREEKNGKAYLNTTVSNVLKVLLGFIPALLTFLNTQNWWVLAWFGAPIWFGITGVRNVIQAIIAGGGVHKNMLLTWKNFVNWSRVCDSLMYTGISVILLEGLTRNLLLSRLLGLTVETAPLLVFSIIALANGVYISSHNIYRGFPRTAVIGNFFRSVLAIPVAMFYNSVLYAVFPLIVSMPPEQILIPAAAIVSKFASDTVAGVIESMADRRNNYRLRGWDYRTKLKHLFDCYTRLELAFPDKDMLALLAQPREFIRFTSQGTARALQVESIVNALDLMYFWYYQPCAQQTLIAMLKDMTREERVVLARFQSILINVQEVCQLFVDGMLGTNFSRALSFYLDNHENYIDTIARQCSAFDAKRRGKEAERRRN